MKSRPLELAKNYNYYTYDTLMIRPDTDVIRVAGVSERIRVAREAVSGELGERPPDTL